MAQASNTLRPTARGTTLSWLCTRKDQSIAGAGQRHIEEALLLGIGAPHQLILDPTKAAGGTRERPWLR